MDPVLVMTLTFLALGTAITAALAANYKGRWL